MDIEEAINELKSLSPSRYAVHIILSELEKKDKEIASMFASMELMDNRIKGLLHEKKDTIIFHAMFNDEMYLIDTQIKNDTGLVEDKIYYIADDILKPTRVKFKGLKIFAGEITDFLIFCCCENLTTGEKEYFNPSSLYCSENKAARACLKKKSGSLAKDLEKCERRD